MPAPKRQPPDLDLGNAADISGKHHPVIGAGQDAFYNKQKKISSHEQVSKEARAGRDLFKKLNARMDDAAWDGLDTMVKGVQSSFRRKGFSQEEVVEEIIKYAFLQWSNSPDDNFLLDIFAEKAYE